MIKGKIIIWICSMFFGAGVLASGCSNKNTEVANAEQFEEIEQSEDIATVITQEGVVIGLWSDGDSERVRQEFYRIDKEHFIGTELWDYMEPEF